MNENEFFRRAVICVCGNYEIEDALHSSLQFFKELMPVDRIFLQVFDYGYSAMRTIATATESESKKLNLLTPLSNEAKDSVRPIGERSSSDVFLFENPGDIAISREMLHFHGVDATSLLVMSLKSRENISGSVVLISEGDAKFTEKHSYLLSLLKDAFGIALSNTLKHQEVIQLKDILEDDNRYLHGELYRISGDEIVGARFGLKKVMERVRQVAALDSPVLLLGETGTGKDLIANAIHSSSPRNNGPFINVNCGAIPESLVESELFGYEKGAFTGALTQKRGRFERADKGTIFLDEIGELPLLAQVRLLKVLQSREIERVGGTKTILLDIRIIAATNRNLEQMVRDGQFREDLWYRLNVFPILIPPLRERPSDIPALVQHFIHLKTKELKLLKVPVLSPGALDTLIAYPWPGNVRELQNMVERELIVNPAGPLSFTSFVSSIDTQPVGQVPIDVPDNLDQLVSGHIRRVLARTDGKIHGKGGAAEILGINPSTLRNRMNKLKIDYMKSGKKLP